MEDQFKNANATTTENNTKCSYCRGFGYTKGAPGAPWEQVDCPFCEGSGKAQKDEKK